MSLLKSLEALKISICNHCITIDWDTNDETFSDREIKILLFHPELKRILFKYKNKESMKPSLGKLYYLLKKEERQISILADEFENWKISY
jgi:hypothetical protein